MSKEFTNFLAEHGIQHETSALQTPQQNGLAERMNQTLLGGSHALLEHSGMTKGFWAEAMGTAAHILNCSLAKTWTGGLPTSSSMGVLQTSPTSAFSAVEPGSSTTKAKNGTLNHYR